MKTIAEQIKWDFEANGDLKIKDKNGKLIYLEFSSGYWEKKEYDSQGNNTYYEDSNGGIRDNRPKLCESKEIVIEGVKYRLTKL